MLHAPGGLDSVHACSHTHRSQHDLLFKCSEWSFCPMPVEVAPPFVGGVRYGYVCIRMIYSISVSPSLSLSLSLCSSLSPSLSLSGPPLSLPLWPSFSDLPTLSPCVRFGTFLCNNECERNEGDMMSQTVSLWAHIMSAADEFQNPSYHPNIEQEVIHIQVGWDSTVQWWYIVGEWAGWTNRAKVYRVYCE